jgi:ketosteroid isomerase-like protein
MIVSKTALTVARACLQAYVEKDRAALEALLADDFHFTSPIDNALDRATYFRVCWPNSVALAGFDDIHEVDAGDRAFIVYEARTSAGKRFRNCEMYTVRNGKLVATEVYFGWDLPHHVPQGVHADDDAGATRDAPAVLDRIRRQYLELPSPPAPVTIRGRGRNRGFSVA